MVTGSTLLVLSLMSLCPRGLAQDQEQSSVSFEEARLATIPEGGELVSKYPSFRPDGKSVAFSVQLGKAQAVYVDGQKGESFYKVEHLRWSDVGGMLVYTAEDDEGMYAVVGGRKSKQYEFVAGVWPSPDGKSFAIEAEDQIGRRFLIHGDKQVENARGPVFGRDGSTLAYRIAEGRNWHVVHLGNKSPAYEGLTGRIFFSPDGRLCYAAIRRGKSFFVMGDAEGEEFDDVGSLAFSPDGKSYAYTAKSGGKWCLVEDGKRGRLQDLTPIVRFSPGGKRVIFLSRESRQSFVVIGDKKGEAFQDVINIDFSPDGESVAYEGYKDGQWYLIVNGERRLKGDSIRLTQFSPDSTSVACFVEQGKKWRVVVGNVRGPECDYISTAAIFSKDGRKLAYGAVIGRELWWKVIDVK